MKKKFFIKNLIMFLFPLLIPILILGSLSIVITQRYIKGQINNSNTNMLKQTKENTDLIFNEMDTLTVQFDNESNMVIKLKSILKKPTLYPDDLPYLDIISNFTNSSANSKPYIHSIYIYYQNENSRFLTTTNGLTTFKDFFDTSWFESYLNHPFEQKMWIETRNIKQYAFQDKPTKLITVYKRLRSNNGVIILNIHADYIETLLNKLVTSPEQDIFILDEYNNVIFTNETPNNIENSDVKELLKLDKNTIYSPSQKKYLSKSVIHSDKYGWNYISVIPRGVLYSVPISLSLYTVILLLISFILGLIITFYLTQKNYKQISNIISIIDSAKNKQALPVLKSNIQNEYSYIIENLLTTFIEQDYLKVQLSERKYKLQTMELIALQSQINPHFLYNTLHAIYWEVVRAAGNENKAIKMIENLSDILDYSLSNPNKKVIILDEIKYTQSYLEIQMARYRDKIKVIWEYDENVKLIHTIKLLIQPLVENCIYHGIKNKEGKSTIKIKIHLKDNFVKIVIIDNGLGITTERLYDIKTKLASDEEYSHHIGLFNTNKRLKLTYGENYGINMNSKLGLGTAVYIKIPISPN